MKASDLRNIKRKESSDVEDARKAMIEAGELPAHYGKTPAERARALSQNVGVPTQVPTITRSAASQRNEEVLNSSGPTEIVAHLTYIGGEVKEIVVKDKEALVAAVDAESNRLKAAGQPSRIAVKFDTRPAGSSISTITETASPVQVLENQPKTSAVERAETKDFTATIKQEGGQWIGELVYKNGAGTERFAAKTKNDLTMQMLIGKGHASVKVRKVIREQKLGVELDKAYIFDGLTQEEFNALPGAAQQQLVDKKAMEAALAFKRDHPDYYSTDQNWQTIRRFLDKRELPFTYTNLDYAFDSLTDDDMLEVREEVASHVVTEAPRAEDSTPVAASTTVAPATVAPAAPAPVLRKRGTTGLPANFSSTGGNTELETEGSSKPRELSEAELKALPLSEHKKLYRASLKQRPRQF